MRLARTRNVDGLSLMAWQATLAVNIGWAAHGIQIGQVSQVVASALAFVVTVPLLALLSRERGLNPLLVFAPGVGVAVLMIVVDRWLGSGAFGVFALIPGVASLAGQSVALVRQEHVRGVSAPFLALAVANQTLWTVWALLVHDLGTLIAAGTTSLIAIFNIAWYCARRFGVRAY